jgi:hypothetical protein
VRLRTVDQMILRFLWLFTVLSTVGLSDSFFALKDVRPGLRGFGRTIFQGNRVEEFQVEVLGVLENIGPRQSIILARLSGGPLAQTGILQGMSGSPVYIDGKLLGAIALGFPFSKEPIAGIQPIEQMIAEPIVPRVLANNPNPLLRFRQHAAVLQVPEIARSSISSPFGNLSEIFSPLSLSGFTQDTIRVFSSEFRRLGFEPVQGVSSGTPKSQDFSGSVVPGSMISVQLLSGDMNMSADGTVTYVDGKRILAFGHRFLDTGTTEIPFARSDVIAFVPNLNTSFKLSSPQQWVGTITSDRNTGIAGEMGRRAHTVPITIAVRSKLTGTHDYHFRVVDDRLLTPFITQTAIFSAIDATERTLGVGTMRLTGRVEFEDGIPALMLGDTFVSDNALPQQVASDAVVPLAFVLGAGFSKVHMKQISFELEPFENKGLYRVAQVWASHHEARPGEAIQITALLQSENGDEITRSAPYQVPVGMPTGSLLFTVSDANTLNFPEFAGLSQTALRSPEQLIRTIDAFRGNNSLYLRVWRQEPSFTIAGPLPGGELTDPPPSVALILADPSSSANTNAALTVTRGAQLAELNIPVNGYAVAGAKTVQVEIVE